MPYVIVNYTSNSTKLYLKPFVDGRLRFASGGKGAKKFASKHAAAEFAINNYFMGLNMQIEKVK